MPDKDELRHVVGRSFDDLRSIRLEGLEKPFEELTISELVQLRPGTEVADSYNVNAVTDNFSASTSSILEELGNIQKETMISRTVAQTRLDQLKPQFERFSTGGGFRRSSASEPGPSEIKLPVSDDDPFSA